MYENILTAILQRWAATPALNDLLPVGNVYVFEASVPTVPHAVVTECSIRPVEYHHDGSAIRKHVVRIEVVDNDQSSAMAITQQVRAAFERASFDISADARVLDTRRTNDTGRDLSFVAGGGEWSLVVDFDCIVLVGSPCEATA